MGNQTLDEILNSRLFRLKQRTLPWVFEIAHLPDKTNTAADATSRQPVKKYAELASLALYSPMDDMEHVMNAAIRHETQHIMALSREDITSATASNPVMCQLVHAINNGFQHTHRTTNDGLAAFWPFRESLHVVEDMIHFGDRVVIPLPLSLREQFLQILHSAHQGVSAMGSRARAIVFWPGITKDIKAM